MSEPFDMKEPPGGWTSMPNPTPGMLGDDSLFEAIWRVIKTWDINVPESYGGYCNANGSHAAAIYLSIKAVLER